MNNIPIFCISMEREVERRCIITEHLNGLNLTAEFFTAVDGQELSTEQLKLYDNKKAQKELSRELKLGELGCYFSHVNLWQKMVTENIPQALVIESDIVFDESISDLLVNLDKLPENWDMVKLYYGDSVLSYHKHHKISEKLTCAPLANKSAGTVAYLISNTGAKKYLAKAYPVYLPIDVYLTGGRVAKESFQYGIEPACAFTNDNGFSYVTESNERDDFRIRDNKVSFFKKLERKIRWFKLKLLKPHNEF